jgi:hypothetical protein
MKCVRCGRGAVRRVAEAPDGSKAWEILQCSDCNFAWRTGEEPETIDPALRDPYFQIGDDVLRAMTTPVPVPPARNVAAESARSS